MPFKVFLTFQTVLELVVSSSKSGFRFARAVIPSTGLQSDEVKMCQMRYEKRGGSRTRVDHQLLFLIHLKNKIKNKSLYLGVKRYLAKNANWGHLQHRIGIWMCWFLRRGENRSTRRKKPLGARTRTNNKLNPHMTPGPGVEPGPHWWEASALTTAPSLLPSQYLPSPLSVSLM